MSSKSSKSDDSLRKERTLMRTLEKMAGDRRREIEQELARLKQEERNK